MISTFKKGLNFIKPKKEIPGISQIKNNLCDGLFEVMEKSFEQRKSDAANSNYTSADVGRIVEEYSKKNMMIAAGASIVPGPFGILGALPELLLNFNNQMSMMYDLGCANGKENFISKDFLLDIPIAVFGGNTDLSKLQASKIDLTDSPEKILKEKASLLGTSIIERTLKKSVVQFIPVAGPVLMGTWAKMTTAKVSRGAILFLDDQQSYVEKVKPEESPEIQRQLQIEKIKGLTNLIEANNDINENQIELISTIIDNSDLTAEEKEYYLEEALRTGSEFKLNKKLLIDYEANDDLMMELVIMAKRSGHVDETEKKYILKLGQELDLERAFVEDLF